MNISKMGLFRLSFLTVVTLVKCMEQYKSDVTLLAEKINDGYNFTCILEGNSLKSALSWIAPFKYHEKLNDAASHYLPPSNMVHDYDDVKYRDDSWVPPDWSLDQAINLNFKPLTDHRWEKLNIVTVPKNIQTFFVEFPKETYSGIFSFRMKTTAILYLCNDYKYNYGYTNCYSITVSEEKLSLLCKTNNGTIQKESKNIGRFNKSNWNEIIIRHTYNINTKVLKVKISETLVLCPIWEYGPLRYILIETDDISLWKIHNYKVLTTNKTRGSSQLGLEIPISSNTFCISLYVSLCSTCTLNITVVDKESNTIINQDVVSKKVENVNSYEESGGTYAWKEVKIIKENVSATSASLYLETINTNNRLGFWAISSIRFCNPKEIRVSRLHINDPLIIKEIACSTFHEMPVTVSKPESEPYCADSTKIGTYCNISCANLFGKSQNNCEKNVICSKKNGNDNCFCSAGYEGSACENECSTGKWGFKCKNNCKRCQNDQCNVISGRCSKGCIKGFVASNCTIPSSVTNVRAIRITVNSITLTWDPIISPNYIFSYIIHYKRKKYKHCKEDGQNAIWEKAEVMTTTITVENLLPYSEYLFKIAATVEKIMGNFIEHRETTSSTDIPGNEEIPLNFTVKHNQLDTFPLILLKEPSCTKMKGPVTYSISFKCSDPWCENEVTADIPFTNNLNAPKTFAQSITLIPYSYYIATLVSSRPQGYINENRLQQQFKTLPNAPPQVRNLTVYSRNESSISLLWKAPYPPNGELDRYIVECVGDNACPYVNVKIPCDRWRNYTCADIINLIENKTYSVSVKAKNKIPTMSSKPLLEYNVIAQQNVSNQPKNVKNIWDGDVPILQWDHPFITNGPLVNFIIEITVLQSEYTKYINSYNVSIDSYNETYYQKMPYLKYSTVYNVSVFPVNKYKGKPSRSITIRMPPPEPKLSGNINISCMELTCQMNISKLENISHSSYLFIVINSKPNIDETLDANQILLNSAQSDGKHRNVWLAIAKPIGNNTNKLISIMLGDGTIANSKYGDAINKPLQNDTNYIITIILVNHYLNKTRYSQPHNIFSTPKERNVKLFEGDTAISPLFLLLLFLFIPIIIGGWLFYKKKIKPNQDSKHLFDKQRLPSCFRGNTDENELLPLHTSKAKPKSETQNMSLKDEGANKPFISESDSKDQFTCRIKLEDFEEYVKQSIGTGEEGELVRQHKLFVRGQTKPWEYGLEKPNKFKNRYNNLIAYDHSRVILEKINDDEFSDYINANYVDGYKKPKAYIATQGPKPTTVGDFWRMVWQENVTTIVTVANVKEDGKRKMEEYWPKLGNTVEYSSMEIYHKKSDVFSNYVYRTLIVTKTNEQRTIQQLHFTAWPDHGVPLYSQSLVPFVKRLLTVPQDFAPIIVHCSAGVGRTGTIILCDYMLRMAACEKAVDFLAALHQMREQRANLVDNANQYKLAHLIVLETLFGLDTTITCNHELEQKIETLINSNGLHKQLEYLENISWQDKAMYSSFKVNVDPANYNKNRFSNIVPDSYGRVYLSRYPTSDEHSDYINAIEVDDYHLTNRFIVTQQPLPNTIGDFWRMISEKKVTTILSINEIDLRNKSSCIFWPEVEEVFDLQFATIKCTEKEEHTSYDFFKILLIQGDEENEYSFTISIISMKHWYPLQLSPNSPYTLLSVWEETSRRSRGHYPIVLTCYDGATASGVFVALSFLIEKIKLEQICDVCLAVRTVRHNRKLFVTSVEQLELLYKSAITYLNSFETYSNFQIINK